jgi:hypothetical protein
MARTKECLCRKALNGVGWFFMNALPFILVVGLLISTGFIGGYEKASRDKDELIRQTRIKKYAEGYQDAVDNYNTIKLPSQGSTDETKEVVKGRCVGSYILTDDKWVYVDK